MDKEIVVNDQKTVKEIAESYAKRIWDEKDITAIDELLHKNCLIHSSLGDFHGGEFMENVVQVWLTAFPYLSVSNTFVISENDLVAIHWQAKGTHLGYFKGLKPTEKVISYSGITIYRVRENKIIEYWAYLDIQHIQNQMKYTQVNSQIGI
jgi:predicted ester cyclase